MARKDKAPAESLQAYIAEREARKLDAGNVLVVVTYPGETARVYEGRYSGIRITDGPVGCMWSDGSKD